MGCTVHGVAESDMTVQLSMQSAFLYRCHLPIISGLCGNKAGVYSEGGKAGGVFISTPLTPLPPVLSPAAADKSRTSTVQSRVLTHLQPYPHPVDTKICGCLSPLYKIVLYLHTACTHPAVYFKSCLDYL